MVPGERPLKMGSRDGSGCAARLECDAEFLANEQCAACNPWHAAAAQLIKLSSVVDCDEVPLEHVPWELKWLPLLPCGSNDDYKGCGVGWMFPSALECLQGENDKLGSVNSHLESRSENQAASMTALRKSLISCSHRGWHCWKPITKGDGVSCWIKTAVEISLAKFLPWKSGH